MTTKKINATQAKIAMANLRILKDFIERGPMFGFMPGGKAAVEDATQQTQRWLASWLEPRIAEALELLDVCTCVPTPGSYDYAYHSAQCAVRAKREADRKRSNP
jgi:hypothetical protein